MVSKFIFSPALNTDKYNTWKKEMQIWELATELELLRQAPTVPLSLEGKAGTRAILELNIITLNVDDGMEKFYAKLDTFFLEDANQSAFMTYESFESYWRH